MRLPVLHYCGLMRKAAWILAVGLVLVTGVAGLFNTPSEFSGASGPLQQSVSLAVLAYGVLGVIGGVGLALRRAWSVRACAAWGVCVVYAATVASFAFVDSTRKNHETVMGTIAAAISTALLAWFVVWAARTATRDNLPRAAESDHIPSP